MVAKAVPWPYPLELTFIYLEVILLQLPTPPHLGNFSLVWGTDLGCWGVNDSPGVALRQ